jgi:CheY-like chemotaxis protein
MEPESPIILMLEDSVHSGMPMQSAVLRSLPEYRLVWARTVAEAREVVVDSPIAVFLLDIELPDGNGIDFLYEACQLQPDARAVVFTGNPLPAYRERTAALGGMRFFEKPVPPAALVSALRDLLAMKDRSAPANAFHGTIKNLTVIDLLQLKCMASATTVIRFQSPSGDGRVFFQQGRIIHAETEKAKGEEALAQIVAFTGGKVVEEPSRPVATTLHEEWQTLLMNAAYAQDVRAAETEGKTPQP